MKVTDLVGKNVIVAPFNAYGVIAYERLKASGVNIKAFFDKNAKYHNAQYEDIPVYPWSYFYDTYVIIGLEQYDQEFHEFLISIRYPEEYILKQSDIEYECSYDDANLNINREEFEKHFGWSQGMAIGQKLARMKRKIPLTEESVVTNMPLIITTRCTLNCEHCFAKIPYFQKKEDVDIDFLISEIERVLQVVDYIGYSGIFGGEPLLHKDLWKLVQYLNQPKIQEKVGHFDILTNGTVLLDEKVIEQIQKNKWFWRIIHSPYGKNSTKQFELFEQLNRSNIFYYERHMPYWHKYGIISEPKETDVHSFEKCKSCCCYYPTFFDGKMYSCEVLPLAGYLNMFPNDKRNYLDIFSEEFTREKFKEFIRSPQPAMEWCNANHKVHNSDDAFTAERIPVAGQAKGILPYKSYE